MNGRPAQAGRVAPPRWRAVAVALAVFGVVSSAAGAKEPADADVAAVDSMREQMAEMLGQGAVLPGVESARRAI